MNNIQIVSSRLLLIAAFAFASACNTLPSRSSSSAAGSPPPPASPSSSSSSSTTPGSPSSNSSGTSSSSGKSSGGPQSQSQAKTSTPGTGKKQSAKQAGTGSTGKKSAQTGAGATGQSGKVGKSDDEILAEALGEFDRGISQSQQAGNDEGEGNVQQAGITGDKGQTGVKGQGALTAAEKSRQLDEKLSRKFSKFDKLMLSEREAVAKSDNERGSGGGSTGASGNGEGEGSSGNNGDDPLQTAMAGGSSNSGSLGIKATRQVDSISDAPADVGDGQDDDIIARQLREAAMKEKDPELRAKLWNEYRKYKKGA